MVSDRPRKFNKRSDISTTPADPNKTSLLESVQVNQSMHVSNSRSKDQDKGKLIDKDKRQQDQAPYLPE